MGETVENKRAGDRVWLIAERVVKAIATFTAGATVVLALFGYGYSLAIEQQFGIPHDAMTDSWIHLVSTGVPPLLGFTTKILLAVSWATFLRLWPIYWMPIVVGTVVLGAVAFLAVRPKRAARSARLSWLRSSVTVVSKWLRRWKDVVVAMLAPIGVLVSMFTALWVFVFLIALVTVFGVLPVMFGAAAGRTFLRESVMDPGLCFPRQDLAHHRSAPEKPTDRRAGVSCIAVLRDGHCVTAGRVVTAAADYVLVFEPSSGRTTKVPTADAIIEAVPDLDAGLPDDCPTQAQRAERGRDGAPAR